MKKKKNLGLSSNITIRGGEEAVYLFNIVDGKKYLLTDPQYEIVKLLDGSKTLEEISEEVEIEEEELSKFINSLEKKGALEYFSDDKEIRDSLEQFSLKPRLRLAHLEITSKCNLNCLHCYQSDYLEKGSEISFGQLKDLVDELVQLGTERVSISGGEPLLYDELFNFLDLLEARNIRISSLFTNGILVSDDVLNRLKSLTSDLELAISLDGVEPETMNLRGVRKRAKQKALLENTISSIQKALDKGFNVRVNTILNDYNYDSLVEMYEYLDKELEGVMWSIGFPREMGYFKDNEEELSVNYDDLFLSCEEIIKKHLGYLDEGENKIGLKVQYLFHEKYLSSLNFYDRDSVICNYDDRSAMCCVKPNGDVLPCPVLMDFVIGNAHSESLKEIWNSDQMRAIKELKLEDLDKCGNCEDLTLCGGGCRATAYNDCGGLCGEDPLGCAAMTFFNQNIKPLILKKDGSTS